MSISAVDSFCQKSLTHAIAESAVEIPDSPALHFLDDKGVITDSCTNYELESASTSLANYLLANHNLKEDDKVLLVFAPSFDFVVSIIACFKASLVAVPVCPPDPFRESKSLRHFMSIQADCGAKVALTHRAYNYSRRMCNLKNLFTWSEKSFAWPNLKWIEVDNVLKQGMTSKGQTASLIKMYPIPRDKVAFIQYTSGSTSEPKGVMVTHGCIEHNVKSMFRLYKCTKEFVHSVSWLPHFHDMGLIGGIFFSIYHRIVLHLMSPLTFLKDPTVWLRSVSKYRAQATGAPSFAFALSTRKFRECKAIPPMDLSCLKIITNGAEPVDIDAVSEFYKFFGDFGLQSDVIRVSYGLAEHTLLVCAAGELVLNVSGLDKNGVFIKRANIFRGYEGSEAMEIGTLRLVSCGKVNGELRGEVSRESKIDVLIVNPETRQLMEDENIGEIWVDSRSKAQGYLNRPDVTQETFHATLAGSGVDLYPGQTFLRTGDLGFIYQNELFFCGR